MITAWPDWGIVRISGPDRIDFLHRLTSNNMRTPAGSTVHTFLLSVQGKPLVEMWAHNLGDEHLIEVPAGLEQEAVAELDKFHFGEKLRMEVLSDWQVLCSLEGPRGEHSFATGRLAAEAHAVLLPEAEARDLVNGEANLELLRIEQGTPRYGQDYDQETLFLEMADPDSYSESKGCYPGQEVVARILHRGRVNRRLVGLSAEKPLTGKLMVEDKEVGWVTSAVESPRFGPIGLGYVRREHNDPGSELRQEDQTVVSVRKLPFA
ncbi:MAG: folate-binding protein YgfZ [Vulcanimicrobiota bacterium]